jgi:predicted RNA binding protein YcfA (HicA-like mRNA interferase family)
MSSLPCISGKKAVQAFEKAGWMYRGQVGSHIVLTKKGERVNLSIPNHKELGQGTLRKLIRYSGLTVEEFIKLL